jgi:catechol 2,3-dioxygenase-like lactoylglutathione lyase family enzyme
MSEMQPDLNQVDLVVGDMEATIAFYRALGVEIPEEAIWRTPSGPHHVDFTTPSGLIVHFDSTALAKVYDQGWQAPSGTGTRNVLSFRVSSREDVDRIHDKLADLGHRSSQPPYDAFWGARFAIVEDPDGNAIGIMSPSDPTRRMTPPDL